MDSVPCLELLQIAIINCLILYLLRIYTEVCHDVLFLQAREVLVTSEVD